MLIRLYRQHHPYARFGAANYVTLVRALLTGFLLLLATRPPASGLAWIAGWTAGAVAALDGVDGWLARRDRMVSAFGSRFDMETDAALLLVLSVLAWRYDKAGAWVLLIGLMRYLFVAAGWVLPVAHRPADAHAPRPRRRRDSDGDAGRHPRRAAPRGARGHRDRARATGVVVCH